MYKIMTHSDIEELKEKYFERTGKWPTIIRITYQNCYEVLFEACAYLQIPVLPFDLKKLLGMRVEIVDDFCDTEVLWDGGGKTNRLMVE